MHKMDNAQTQQDRRPGATSSDWWRFSSYEIRDECIVAAEGAKLEWYDPWIEFGTGTATVGQAPGAVQPAYQSLMKLAQQLGLSQEKPLNPASLSQTSRALILEWCQRHGLLGVLLSRWESISLAPQQVGEGLWIHQKYSHAFGQVVQVQTTRGDVEDREATVSIHELNDHMPVDEPPGRTWGRFFPSVPFSQRDTFPYPRPYTVEFFRLYGEPLMDFCKAARLLVGAISFLGPKQPESNTASSLAREQALEAINLLRGKIPNVLDPEGDGSPKERRVAPSLLASFADMAVQDWLYGRSILQCTCCNMPFVSGSYQAQYCSVSCRLRHQKRRLRAQMKQARALRAEGQDLPQIAATVGQTSVIVKGWLQGSTGKRVKFTGGANTRRSQ